MNRRNLCCKPNSFFINVNCDASIGGNDFIGEGFVVCNDKWNLKGAGVDCVEENFTCGSYDYPICSWFCLRCWLFKNHCGERLQMSD